MSRCCALQSSLRQAYSLEKEHRLFYSLVKQMDGLEGLPGVWGAGARDKGEGKQSLPGAGQELRGSC